MFLTPPATKTYPGFDQVKGMIAKYESASGRLKIHVNKNLTIDCGKYQINSKHFNGKGVVGKAFDRIFNRFGVGSSLHERVCVSIQDDRLNEELARKLYEMQGLKPWMTSEIIKKQLKAQAKKR